MDFTNLNATCPKDNYLLLSVDHLVEKRARAKMLRFMDAHAGYNQIHLSEEDEEKTTFITDKGTFCYKRVHFGLRNEGATFQKLMDKIFLN